MKERTSTKRFAIAALFSIVAASHCTAAPGGPPIYNQSTAQSPSAFNVDTGTVRGVFTAGVVNATGTTPSTFTSISVSGLTANKPVQTDANSKLVSGLISLSTAVTGTLPVGNGGTGLTTNILDTTNTWTAQQSHTSNSPSTYTLLNVTTQTVQGLAIGTTTTPSFPLHVRKDSGFNSFLSDYGGSVNIDTLGLFMSSMTARSSSNFAFNPLLVYTRIASSGTQTTYILTGLNAIAHIGSNDTAAWGLNSYINAGSYLTAYEGSGSVGATKAITASMDRNSTGTITTGMVGLEVASTQRSAAIAGTVGYLRYLNLIRPVGVAGTTFTNIYGAYIANMTPALGTLTNTPYGIYQEGTGDFNYFGGKVGLGTTAPSSALHISSGAVTLDGSSGGITLGTASGTSGQVMVSSGSGKVPAWSSVPCAVQVGSGRTSPADGLTYYVTSTVQAAWTFSETNQAKIIIPAPGRIMYAWMIAQTTGTLGTAELSTATVRINGASTTLGFYPAFSSATGPLYSTSSVSGIPVAVGDYVSIQLIGATWATNPTQIDASWGIWMIPL